MSEQDLEVLLERYGDDFRATFGSQEWRLNNLYKIQTAEGPIGTFKMSPMQQEMYRHRWWRNLILKVRQIGSSTLWCLFILDCCLFGKDPVRAGIIAQTRPKAADLLSKCKFAFESMDPVVKEAFGLTMSGGKEKITFGNGSRVESGTTMRSGTLDVLLVSEMGKLAKAYPSKAREVINGTLPALHSDAFLVIESTAEGHDGLFFDMVETAAEIQENPAAALGKKDMRLHFFPWWGQKEYRDDDPYDLTDVHNVYFEKLRMRGILLDKEQKWWWARKKDVHADDMAQEYPSYQEEAFQVAGGGLYLAKAMITAEEKGQVGSISHDPNLPCVTFWDLGKCVAIWICQYRSPLDRVYIDYLEGESHDFDHWALELQKRADLYGYRYGAHVFPWDGNKQQGMTATYKTFAMNAGLTNIEVVEIDAHAAQVVHANMMMPRSYFDLKGTMTGRKRILSYRRRLDRVNGGWAEEPVKNIASHGAEAFILSTRFTPTNLYMPPSTGVGDGGIRPKGDDRSVWKKMLGIGKGQANDQAAMVQAETRSSMMSRIFRTS